MREYYVYILASKKNGTLYVGMAKKLGKRITSHKDSRASEFTGKYSVRKLVYYEKHNSQEEAIKREKQLKKWNRRWKLKLIEKQNPEWDDLLSRVIKGTKSV